MYKKILVPSDFSNPSAAAFSTATQMARLNSAAIVLLHVIEVLRDTPFEELKDFYQDIEQSVRAKMKSVSDSIASPHVCVTSSIRYGNRLQEILSSCREERADLVVVQSHQMNPSEPHEGWGTLSQRLAIIAPCAVLLVR